MRRLLALLVCTPIVAMPLASAAADEIPSLAKADRLALQRDIVAGESRRAVKRLDRLLPAGRWCEATLPDEPAVTVARQFRADLGVLARRVGRTDEALECLMATFARRTPKAQAQTLIEAGLLAGHLTPEQSRRLLTFINTVAYAPECPGGRPCSARLLRAHFNREAAAVLPTRANMARLDTPTARDTGAFAAPFHAVPGVRVKSRRDALNRMIRAYLPDSPPGEVQTELAVVGRGGPWTLLDVQAVPADGEDTFDRIRRWLLLHRDASGALTAFDLGDLGWYRMADEVTFDRWDAAHGTLRVGREQWESFYGASPMPAISSHESVLCQSEGGVPRCISATRQAWHAEEDHSIARSARADWRWSAGRLQLTAPAGGYVVPGWRALEGLTLTEALAVMPEVRRAVAVSLGHPGAVTP